MAKNSSYVWPSFARRSVTRMPWYNPVGTEGQIKAKKWCALSSRIMISVTSKSGEDYRDDQRESE
jgi:hypothetical protein